ncbi:MAG: deoxyribose-phosphate aldolase [Legionellaceae bacterium]|nr:deoxyribose-phosphate aldolase [Legionellaceae bacterium]
MLGMNIMDIPGIIGLIDLTRLNTKDPSEEEVTQISVLCKNAKTAVGPVAAVCVYPEYVAQAKEQLKDSSIRIATVVNFPTGNEPLDPTLAAITKSIAEGADEIDVVLPYEALKKGDTEFVIEYLKKCREATGDRTLKVIIESGVLNTEEIIAATTIVADIGADFVKTSTGKVPNKGATLEAVEAMLTVLKTRQEAGKKSIALKISGGITGDNVENYLELIEKYMGPEWLTSENVRIGASALLKDLLTKIPSTAPQMTFPQNNIPWSELAMGGEEEASPDSAPAAY